MDKIFDVFGSNVFNDAVMKERLPEDTYNILKSTIKEGKGIDSSIADTVASAMRENIGGAEEWMCGFPEKYIVIKVDDYVVSGYGKVDMIDNLKAAFTETYTNAVVVCDEVIA